MFDVFGKRFFRALRDKAELKLGADHPCVLAVGRAAETGDKTDIEAAQQGLSELPAGLSDELMETVHKALREDPEALLEMWGGKGNAGRPN